ncbi:HPt (histidine-containing phosphotransfer) domain-containing protein [Mucilaginibacter mallensis]|uniref:HPt (Histidine-containing phosphotransfer) domain-containing protein n=1 Tax=Mucilaginibacter mallensis TaxID=652787 RepID=A0A1H1YHS5_MUCMA|nr:Hpt domain-containing protein [Mucilaginibacter mallensis]SDT21088.1 HPt (histidine-containing phosphotransfer) domain-containing protein [Mucilaginibacter mallensis]
MPDTSPDKDIDLSTLYDIADGSNEFIVESITMFLDQVPGLLQDIGNAIAGNEWPTAAAAAHKVKANLSFFGMFYSQTLVQELEILCKSASPDPAEITAKFNQLNDMMADNLAALELVKTEKEANL